MLQEIVIQVGRAAFTSADKGKRVFIPKQNLRLFHQIIAELCQVKRF